MRIDGQIQSCRVLSVWGVSMLYRAAGLHVRVNKRPPSQQEEIN